MRHSGRSVAENRNPEKQLETLDSRSRIGVRDRPRGNDMETVIRYSI